MLISIISLFLVAYFGLGIVLYFMQPSLTFSPTREVPYTPSDLGLDYEKVLFRTADDVALSGWYISVKDAKFTFLICHGNGGNISYALDTVNIINELGFNCFIFDYRGYGNSHGSPTEEGTYLDAQAAYDWLTKEKKISPQNIIILGKSLGGSIAAHLASNVEAKGLIVESGFTSYGDIGQKFYPYLMVRPFARYNFNTFEYLKKVDCPVLIIHSRIDEVVPFEFGLRLYEQAAKEPKEFLEIFGSHNDGFLYSGQIYREGLSDWVESIKNYQKQKSKIIKIVS
ncbi:MAG: alpha/beta hydrolase [Sedimentisphaerales bacterium]|jgi:fermentation-respiration switch protein FrsA (DUF1100 family)